MIPIHLKRRIYKYHLRGKRFSYILLSIYNRKYAVHAIKEENLHRQPEVSELDFILCIKTVRTVKNDYTIQYKNRAYQIEERIIEKKLIVEERMMQNDAK
ncbi:MAG: hypothetical protein N2745_11505 [Syntrophorhabdaceae bacterium]|nr:hypothetical protein [Syntrophorhabdaceae bacterium]